MSVHNLVIVALGKFSFIYQLLSLISFQNLTNWIRFVSVMIVVGGNIILWVVLRIALFLLLQGLWVV